MPLTPAARAGQAARAARDTLRERRVGGVEATTVVGVAVVVVALVVALALTLAPPRRPPDYTPVGAAAPSAAPTPATGASGPADAPATGSTGDAAAPVALVVGDGYAAGPGRRSFGCLAARDRGWTCLVVAAAGSGYLASGPSGTFADQLAAAAGTPDVGLVVVSGGGLDADRPRGELRSAATDLVAAARATFPDATVVLVPPFREAVDTAATRALTAALRAASDGRSVRFADPDAWFPGDRIADGPRLTSASRTAAADALAAELPPAAPGEV